MNVTTQSVRDTAAGLRSYYCPWTGLFGRGKYWWHSAVATSALIDSVHATDDPRSLALVARIHHRNRRRHQGQFRNSYVDDTGWWAMAWIDAYRMTGRPAYLESARIAADHMAAYWDERHGGGVYWRTYDPHRRRLRSLAYKASIANSLFIQVQAALSVIEPTDRVRLDRALAGWRWLRSSGLINPHGLVQDGINSDGSFDQSLYSYNQGVLCSALAELHLASGDGSLLTAARGIGDALTTRPELTSPAGILRDRRESSGDSGDDGPVFKGPTLRGLGALTTLLADHPYDDYIVRQATSLLANAGDGHGRYGLRWDAPFDRRHIGHQVSALCLVNAAWTVEDRRRAGDPAPSR